MSDISTAQIHTLMRRGEREFRGVILRSRIRRALVQRDLDSDLPGNATGTVVPDPFSRSALIMKTMIGEPGQAVMHYASRYAANAPTVEVMPLTVKDDVSAKLDKIAGEQELFDALLLDDLGVGAGDRANQRKCGMAQAITESAYYVVMPTDLSFGVPARAYYSDEEAETLKSIGKVAPVRTEQGWAEHADAWRERRHAHSRKRASEAVSGLGLFDCQVYPRDMVFKGTDADGIKWAAVVEDIPADECAPGSDLAMAYARKKGTPEDDVGLWGLWRDRSGRIIGGIEQGGPVSEGRDRTGTWMLIRFFTREEMVILVAPRGDYQGGEEVYRCRHGAKDQGRPVCPVVEVPAIRMDIATPGKDVIGPASSVFAYSGLINQLETMFSLAAGFNTVPRWIVEDADGATLRSDDGSPKMLDNGPTPGLDPKEAASYPGTLRQLTIDTTTIEKLLPVYLEQLAAAMPAPATMGASAATATAWGTAQNIQQAQLTLQEPVDNHRNAVKRILRMCHSWLRDLDTPVCFYKYPAPAYGKRGGRALVEFDPRDITDSFEVVQGLDTPDEALVREQLGMEKLAQGLIDYREYYETYANVRDARESVIRMWQHMITSIVMGKLPAVPGTVPAMVADQVRGTVNYRALEEVPNYALATADQMAMEAQMQAQQATQALTTPPGGGEGPENVAAQAGVRRPGMGMAPTLGQQQGPSAPTMAPMPGGGV